MNVSLNNYIHVYSEYQNIILGEGEGTPKSPWLCDEYESS